MLFNWFGFGRPNHFPCTPTFDERLKEIEMKVSDLAANLAALDTQLTKAQGEILGKIADLEAALAGVGDLPQEAVDALAALQVSAAALDDIVPDAV